MKNLLACLAAATIAFFLVFQVAGATPISWDGNFANQTVVPLTAYLNAKTGIGTTSPTSLLNISGSDAGTTLTAASVAMLDITNSNSTNNNFSDLAFSTADANGNTVVTSKIAGVNTVHTGSATSGDLAFLTRSAGSITEKVRILASGKVGIGTTTPWGLFSINANGITGPQFAVGSSTKTDFVILNNGNVGVGNSAPTVMFTVGTANQFTVNSGGNLVSTGNIGISGITNYIGTSATASGNPGLTVGTNQAARPNLVIKQIASQTANMLDFRNSSEVILSTVDASGRIGAGTSTPWGQLSASSTSASPTLAVQQLSTGPAGVFLGGNIGIGTLTPQTQLSTGITGGTIKLATYDDGTGTGLYGIGRGSGTLTFGASITAAGTPQMVLNSSGNIGVGSTSPFARLSVQGAGTGTGSAFQITNSSQTPEFNVTDSGVVTALTSFGNLGGSSSITFPSGRILLTSGGQPMWYMNNGIGVRTHANTYIGWSSTSDPSAAADTGLYRYAAGVVGVGSGGSGVGSTTGTLLVAAIGIGTTSPVSVFTAVAASTTAGTANDGYNGLVHIIAGLENTVTKLFQVIDQWGHRIVQADSPTLASCGTSTLAPGSTDTTGVVVLNGVLLTSCQLVFAHPFPTTAQIVPVVSTNTTSAFADVTATSTSNVTFGLSAGLNSGYLFYQVEAYQP